MFCFFFKKNQIYQIISVWLLLKQAGLVTWFYKVAIPKYIYAFSDFTIRPDFLIEFSIITVLGIFQSNPIFISIFPRNLFDMLK